MKDVFIGSAGLVSAAGNNVEEHLHFNGFSGDNIPLLDYAMLSKRLSSARKAVKFMSCSAILMELAATEALQNVVLSNYPNMLVANGQKLRWRLSYA